MMRGIDVSSLPVLVVKECAIALSGDFVNSPRKADAVDVYVADGVFGDGDISYEVEKRMAEKVIDDTGLCIRVRKDMESLTNPVIPIYDLVLVPRLDAIESTVNPFVKQEESEQETIEIEMSEAVIKEYSAEQVSSETKEYYEFLHLLYAANRNDLFILKLGNYGGALEQCIKICNAMKATAGKVIVSVDAPCYSAGAVIALCGDDLEMLPGTLLMFHNYSGEEHGKAGEMKTSVEAHNKLYKRVLETTTAPFLNKAEIRRIVNDQDVYVYDNDPDIKKRIKRHYK